MDIILNQKAWVEERLIDYDLGKKPGRTLTFVARYYFDLGLKKSEVKTKLNEFVSRADPTSTPVMWQNAINNSIKHAEKIQSVNEGSIFITKKEMETIETIEGKRAQRIAFAMLCLAKYTDLSNGRNGHWINYKDSQVQKMANVSCSPDIRNKIFHYLYKNGFIELLWKVNSRGYKVMFVDDESEPVLEVKDFRNLGYQYLDYHHEGGEFYVCQNCGIHFKYTKPKQFDGRGGKPKYCPDCAHLIKMKQTIDSAMRVKESTTHPLKGMGL